MMDFIYYWVQNPQKYFICAGITLVIMALAEKHRWWNWATDWFFRTQVHQAAYLIVACAAWPVTISMLLVIKFIQFVGWVFQTEHH